jgi:hypothetical protein
VPAGAALSLSRRPFPKAPLSTRPRRSSPSDGDRDGWLRPIVLAVSCLVIGFVLGYVVRGGGDGSSALVERPPATTAPAATDPAQTSPDQTSPGTTAPADTTATTTSTTPELPPARSEVRLAVLNGTNVQGLAGRTATSAEELGYVDVAAANAPPQTGGSVAYFRPGSLEAAELVAEDLDILGGVLPLPAGGALAEAAPPGADVIVVLGPGTG